MGITVYGIKTCDTCRKALKQLQSIHADVEFHDVRADPLGADLLKKYANLFEDSLMNTRSTTWRGLSEAERGKPMIALLTEHPTLMKRPIVESDEQTTLGWGKDVQAKWL